MEDCVGRRVVVPPRGAFGLLWAAARAWEISRYWRDHLCLYMEEGDVVRASLLMALVVSLLPLLVAAPAVVAAVQGDWGAAAFVVLMGFVAAFSSFIAYGVTRYTIEDSLCCGVVGRRRG